jgi:hypothetical protein
MGERGEEDVLARVAAQDGVAEAAGDIEARFAGHRAHPSLRGSIMQLVKPNPVTSGAYFRFALAALVMAAATVTVGCDVARSQKPDLVEINWTVLRSDAVLHDADAGRQLKMRIPVGYVSFVGRDKNREEERLSGVKNDGISVVDLVSWLPDLSPTPPIKETKEKPLSEEQKHALFHQRIYIQLSAAFVRSKTDTSMSGRMRSKAKNRMSYRLPNQYGLERYRRMHCPPDVSFDAAKFDEPRELPPEGCRDIIGDESLVGNDSGVSVWITCGRGEGRCAMRTYFQGRWQITVAFSRAHLETWRDVKGAVETLLTKFVVSSKKWSQAWLIA